MALSWRYFNSYMTAQDLSDFDDYLSHVLLDTVGTEKPLGVHHMKPRARLPFHDTTVVLKVIRKRIIRPRNQNVEELCFKATDAFLRLPFVVKYLKKKSQDQIDAFATHAWRYFKLYVPFGAIEIAHTSRYTFRTKKSELCVLALAPIPGGEYIEQLEGSMARLTPEEDAELSRTRANGYESRRDFSVVQILGGNRSLLFLGPARFVNHDCNANCELERKDKVMRFKTKRAIAAGEEITAHYADDYFGKDNRECLCQTCEENGRGGWAEAGKPAPSGKMTATPESPTAKRLKVSGRTLKIDSSDSSGIDGAHAGSAEDEDNPSATAAAQRRTSSCNRKDLQLVPSEGEERKAKNRKAKRLPNRRASSNAASIGSHIPGVKYPQMRRNLPRGPGGQFRRKKTSGPSTPGQSESEPSDDGSNGDDERENEAFTHASRSTRRASTSLSTTPKSPALGPTNVKVETPVTPTVEETKQIREISISVSQSLPPAREVATVTASVTSATVSARGKTSARHSAPDKPSGHPKVKQETSTLSSVHQEVTTRKLSGKATVPSRLSSHDPTPRHTRSHNVTSDEDVMSRQESDDVPKRVLRPRISRTAADGSTDAKMEISPTAPHIRQLNTLQKRTEKTRPTWKGWVSIPNGACDVCFQVHEELKGREPAPDEKLICNRCKRHHAIYGEKWPYRDKGGFTDLSSTTSSDGGESSSSSEGGTPIRSTRLLKKRLAQKAAQLAASTASSAHASHPTRLRNPSRGRSDEVARRARRRAKSPKSDSDDSSSPDLHPSSRNSRKQDGNPQVISIQARKSVLATAAKIKENDLEPLSKKRRLTVSAVIAHVAGTATAPLKAGAGAGPPNEKKLARAARARARLLLKENPDLDLNEIKVAAAAGVMRSGRARAAISDKMPVTGPPITAMSKRKRTAVSDEDDSEEDTTHLPTRRGMRISSAVSVKSEPRPTSKFPSTNEKRGVVSNMSPRKTRTLMPGVRSPWSKKTQLHPLSGNRWGAPDDPIDESEVEVEKDTSPPVRRPLLSFTPNPTFFAMRKHALSDPAGVEKSHENCSSVPSSSAAPAPQTRVKIIVSDLSSDGMDGQLSEDEHSALRPPTILHLSSSYTPDMKDILSEAMDISDIESRNAPSESRAIVTASVVQDELNGTGMIMEVDVAVDKTETELTLVMDGASSDLTQVSAPSVASSVPSSASSTAVGTPQVPLPAEPVAIRDDSPASTVSSPSQTSRKGNVRTYQTWKRSHVGVKLVRPS